MISIHLFATREDLLELLECVESEAPLKYSRMGYFTEAEFRAGLDSYEEGAMIPGLGVATDDSGVGCPRFLVSNRGTPVGVRSINTYNDVHHCVDERGNPGFLVLAPGGIWEGSVLLSGSLASGSYSRDASRLLRKFRKCAKALYEKIGAYDVGPRAAGRMRLTASARAPREYDLTL